MIVCRQAPLAAGSPVSSAWRAQSVLTKQIFACLHQVNKSQNKIIKSTFPHDLTTYPLAIYCTQRLVNGLVHYQVPRYPAN